MQVEWLETDSVKWNVAEIHSCKANTIYHWMRVYDWQSLYYGFISEEHVSLS